MTTMYTPDHEWINIEDHEAAVVGITHHAQDALGDVVFVELPEVGRTYKQGDVAGVVESVKAAADIYMPVTGEVVEVNEDLRANPALANTDPLGNGWFFKVHITNMGEFDQLMDPPAYDALLKTLMSCSIEEAAEAMHLPPPAVQALRKEGGPWQPYLDLLQALEAGDMAAIESLSGPFGGPQPVFASWAEAWRTA